jgi:hypothetical protein
MYNAQAKNIQEAIVETRIIIEGMAYFRRQAMYH